MKTNYDWNLISLYNVIKDFLSEKGFRNPKLEAELIISYVLKIPRLEIYLQFEKPLEKDEVDKIRHIVAQRANYKPLQYIFGETEFYGYKFFVNENVLIPRPETEQLVDLVLKENEKGKVLDLGTGSGAIPITLKKERKIFDVIALDISEEALVVAKKNAKLNQIKINFIKSDLFENINEKFDIIISNPPYISAQDYSNLDYEIKKYEPKQALIADEGGLFYYRSIMENAKDYLSENGVIYFEIGENQALSIKRIAENNFFKNIKIVKDLAHRDRIMKIY